MSITPALVIAALAIVGFVVLAVFGTLSSGDAAALIVTIAGGFGLGNGHAVQSGSGGGS